MTSRYQNPVGQLSSDEILDALTRISREEEGIAARRYLLDIQRHQLLHLKGQAKLRAIEQEYLGLSEEQQKAMRLPYLTLQYGISAEENWLTWATYCLEALDEKP